jgi:UDP-glucose 4-epimerase
MRNLAMGQTVTTALARQPVHHVVYISSDAVYPFGDARVSEATPAVPTDLYSAMHRTRELMMQAAVAADRLAILRPTMMYGAGDTHNSYGPNRFRRQAAKDGLIRLGGGGEETRDHIYIDDCAGLVCAVLRQRGVGLLNLATGTSSSFDAIARRVAAQFAAPVTVEHTPRSGPITHRQFDVSLLKQSFPDYAFTTLADGVAAAHIDITGGG